MINWTHALFFCWVQWWMIIHGSIIHSRTFQGILESNQDAGRSLWWTILSDECNFQSIFAKTTLNVHFIYGWLANFRGKMLVFTILKCNFLNLVPWIFALSSESSLSKSTGIEIPFLWTFVDVGGVGLNGLDLNKARKLWLGRNEPWVRGSMSVLPWFWSKFSIRLVLIRTQVNEMNFDFVLIITLVVWTEFKHF